MFQEIKASLQQLYLDRFDERGDAAHLLKPRAGNSILRPQNQHYLPDRESLTWHRQHHGFE
jgi:predicted restriction endonuclease